MSKRKKSTKAYAQEAQYQEALYQYQMAQQQNTSARGWTIKEVASVMATFDAIGRLVTYGGVVLGILMLIQLFTGLDPNVLYAAQKLLLALVAFMILYKSVYDQFVDDEE